MASEIITSLIADVRGYTSFTQTHGDEAAARLASTLAELARVELTVESGRELVNAILAVVEQAEAFERSSLAVTA